MDNDTIYFELRRHLDRMPVPLPATESGVEIRILKRLFTPEEARLALLLSAIPEPVHVIHRRVRLQMSRQQLGEALERMAAKGIIQSAPGKNGPLYGKAPLVLGMYEYQVNRLTPELERDMRAYLDEGFGKAVVSLRTPQMRTVPVNKSIRVEHAAASYEDMRRFVEASPGPFAALDCICRQGKALTGEPCRHTSGSQNCLMFGAAAEAMVERAGARPVSKEQMLELLEQADREALVLQPHNTREPMFVCSCCGCCCGVLTAAKRMARPADFFQTSFQAVMDAGSCQRCGTCESRCQMGAIAAGDGAWTIAGERCIGCGLCVTTCPTGAVRLVKREGCKPPPADVKSLYLKMFQNRYGRLGAAKAMAGHLLGRKF